MASQLYKQSGTVRKHPCISLRTPLEPEAAPSHTRSLHSRFQKIRVLAIKSKIVLPSCFQKAVFLLLGLGVWHLLTRKERWSNKPKNKFQSARVHVAKCTRCVVCSARSHCVSILFHILKECL